MYPARLVRALVLHFADLAGWEGDRYVVTLSRRTFDRAAKRYRAEPIAADELGATLVTIHAEPERHPVTWINDQIPSVLALAQVCAHEALHAARPTMPHGPAYDRAVRRMLRGKEP